MVQVEDDMMPQPESPRHVDHRARVENIMRAMAQGRVRPLLDALADDVTWRWMGVKQWSRAIEGKQSVVDTLFGGASETLPRSSKVEVHCIHADGEFVVVEHSGRNELSGGRRYDNNYCWVFRFAGGLIHEVREYMDTQLVTETFGPDENA
jgi:ketosteroid isomerase-like protein